MLQSRLVSKSYEKHGNAFFTPISKWHREAVPVLFTRKPLRIMLHFYEFRPELLRCFIAMRLTELLGRNETKKSVWKCSPFRPTYRMHSKNWIPRNQKNDETIQAWSFLPGSVLFRKSRSDKPESRSWLCTQQCNTLLIFTYFNNKSTLCMREQHDILTKKHYIMINDTGNPIHCNETASDNTTVQHFIIGLYLHTCNKAL